MGFSIESDSAAGGFLWAQSPDTSSKSDVPSEARQDFTSVLIERLGPEVELPLRALQPGGELARSVRLGKTDFTLFSADPSYNPMGIVSANGDNSAPLVLSSLERMGAQTSSALDKTLEAYLLQTQREQRAPDGEFNPRNPATTIFEASDFILDEPTDEHWQPLSYLDKPGAPQVRALQDALDARVQSDFDTPPQAFLADDGKAITALSASDLAKLINIMEGGKLPDASLHPVVSLELSRDYYENRPDTQLDSPYTARYINPQTGASEDIVFRLREDQQQLLGKLYEDHDRRSDDAARQILAEPDRAEVDAPPLPYSEAELRQMGLDQTTDQGKATVQALTKLAQRVGGPEKLREMLAPAETRFATGFNRSQNDDFDFRVTLLTAGIAWDKYKEGEPVKVSEVNDPFFNALLKPETKTHGGTYDPNKQFISLNLPLLQERATKSQTPLSEELVAAISNEVGNLIFSNTVKEQTGFTTVSSIHDLSVIASQAHSSGMPGEIFSDTSEVWFGLSADQRSELNDLAARNPEQAVAQLVERINATISNESNLIWSQMEPNRYEALQTQGDLTATEILAHRYGVVYKAINGGNPNNLIFKEDREFVRKALETSLKTVGMNDAFVQAYSSYIFDALLPTAIEASTWANQQFIFDDSPDQHAASLEQLGNNGR